MIDLDFLEENKWFIAICSVTSILGFILIGHMIYILIDIPKQPIELAQFYIKTKEQLYNLKNIKMALLISLLILLILITFYVICVFLGVSASEHGIIVVFLNWYLITTMAYFFAVYNPTYIAKTYVSDSKILEEYHRTTGIDCENKKITLQEILKNTKQKIKERN